MFHVSFFVKRSILILIFLGLTSQVFGQTLAFPGAEGFGKFTKGGRGGKVMEVTNLNDSGQGSLRACIQASGPRICVFRVSGIINVNSDLKISNPYITIAGQTAPGGGITLRNGPNNVKTTLRIDADEIIIRHIAIRPGLGGGLRLSRPVSEADSISFRTSGAKNVIIDHVSATWATDETISTSDNTNVTVSWSIIANPLNCSVHWEQYCHGFGSILFKGKTGGGVTFHHNLWANTKGRNPQIDANGANEIVNNVIYNAQGQSSSWGPSHIKDKSSQEQIVDYFNNYLKEGPDTIHDFWISSSANNPRIYETGTGLPSGFTPLKSSDEKHRASTPYSIPNDYKMTPTSATQAYTDVLADVGATRRLSCDGKLVFRRDPVDTELISGVKNGTGRIICNSFSGTPKTSSFKGNCKEGVDFTYPVLDTGTACSDGDHDGMPDVWEVAQGLNPNNSADGPKDADGNGYTNLEEYLNGSSETSPDTDPPSNPVGLDFVAN